MGTSLSAQYAKGTVYVSQATQFQHFGSSDNLPRILGFQGRGGFFVRDRLLVGSAVQIGELPESNSFVLTPFARYYVSLPNKRNLHFFGEGALGVNLDNNAALSPQVAVGAEYWLAPGVVLTGSAGYNFGNDRERNLATIDFGLNVLLGEEHETDPTEGYLHQGGDLFFNPSIGNLTFGNFSGSQQLSLQSLRLDGGLFLSEQLSLAALAEFNNVDIDIGIAAAPRVIGSSTLTLGAGFLYQFNAGARWQPYAQAGVRYVSFNLRNTIFVNGVRMEEITDNYLTFDLGPGVFYHFSRVVALDAGLRWRPLITEDAFFPPGDQVGFDVRIVVFPSRGRSGK